MSKKIKKALPLHVLPNQCKHPKVGDTVMVGTTNTKTKNNEWVSASIIQVTPARHDDQSYRFKWQIVNKDPGSTDTISSGWTNEHQRVNTRDSKLDDRIDTHASFDFVRHCDILEMNKYDVERKLFQDLSTTTMIQMTETTTCFVCNKGFLTREDGTQKYSYITCCCAPHHEECDANKWVFDVLSKKGGLHKKDVKKDDGSLSLLCPLCDGLYMNASQTKEERHKNNIELTLKGNPSATWQVATDYLFGCNNVTKNLEMAEMLLLKIVGDKKHPHCGEAYHKLGLIYCNQEWRPLEDRRAKCKSFWELAIEAGYSKSQEELDHHRLVSDERAIELDLEAKNKTRRAAIEKRIALARGTVSILTFFFYNFISC